MTIPKLVAFGQGKGISGGRSPKLVAFGQGKGISGGTSPKSVTIRTEVGDIWRNESEVGQHSDRKSGNPEVRVRSRSLFGQEKRKFGGTSPKSVTIRTGKAEIRRYESEVGPYSDRKSGNSEVRVRS
ncbi:hypothetical protein [Cytobacillus firmus]|uniref:hypothetical protein n=1 Tax=Cytobacillus firmus TaxID=1399 RepID=UPI0021637099|nr:hypothetical protein [Cytobacillus firmus]MCS0673895.1 hypothetical protein [Cytobacillus firmus]